MVLNGPLQESAEGVAAESVTGLLTRWSGGDPEALNRLMPLVYHELRRLARSHLRRSNGEQTLDPTGLVHEVYLRLANRASVEVESRVHFYAIAAHIMRCVLVDHARRRHAAKRSGNRIPVDTARLEDVADRRDLDLIALHDALTSLAAIDPLKSRIVELRYFGGLTVDDAGEVLGLSPRSVARQWAMAKAWLYGEIKRAGSS